VLTTHYQAIFLVPLPRRKKISARGVSHAQPFTLLLFCFILFLLALFYQKYKKNSSFIVVSFTCLLFSLARMSNPEVEIRTLKQQGEESLQDAWYRISNAHHRCTKKHSTMILLRNFYVGISSWNRLIRLQRIYNFLCSMLVFTPFALCFVTLRGTFMHFPELTY
jgi:hypothetical protein